MTDSLYIAWKYLAYQKTKTVLMLISITLIIFLPAGLNLLVNESAENLRSRARQTPLVLGARGSRLELVLNSLYFESKTPPVLPMSEVSRLEESGLARAIPMNTRFQARGRPIVGTSLAYFEFRQLSILEGRQLAQLGECVLGNNVAHELEMAPGDSLISSPESVFDLAGVYPLKINITGILAPTGGPDDDAIFVDLKTVWVIAGFGHGHVDLNQPEASGLLLDRKGNRLTANAAVVQYNEITPVNIDSFHFHGEQSSFPITAIIAVPNDLKARTILQGRYLASDEVTQIVAPATVMDELLATILKVRRFMIAGSLLVGMATVLMALLVFVLSIRLRRGEIATMRKLGAAPSRIASILACEVLFILVISLFVAGSLTTLTARFGDEFIRWLIV